MISSLQDWCVGEMYMAWAHVLKDPVQGQFNKDGLPILSSFSNRRQVLLFLPTPLWSAHHPGPIPSSAGLPDTLIWDQGSASNVESWNHFWTRVGCYSASSLSQRPDWELVRTLANWQTRPSTSLDSSHIQQACGGKSSVFWALAAAWPSARHFHTHFLMAVSQ